jgi:ABC-type dipeptide/oligopeptide/nickel transport system permease component
MQRFIVQRILWNIPVLLLISVVTFGMMQIVPGGPFSGSTSGRPVPPEIRANMEAKYGLDKPVWQQYLSYMERLLFHLDFGPSLRHKGRTVTQMLFGPNYMVDVLREQLRATFGVAASSLTFADAETMTFAEPGLFDSSTMIVKTNGEVIGEISIGWGERIETIKRFLTLAPVMVSIQVGLLSVVLATAVGVPLGIVSALRQNTSVDYTAMFVSMLGVSIPNFLLGIMLILFFALTLEWLPTYGWGDDWKQVIMPAATLGTGGMAFIARLTRASMLEVIRADYIRTARAKGLSEGRAIRRHAFRNALIPVLTVMGLQLGFLLNGSIVVEQVFQWPGIGRLLFTAVTQRDMPLIQGIVLFIAAVFVFANLLVDLLYAVLDPRIRYD